ncbi:MAG TPA: L-histidine N(alpha)-methyltransferase [Candidatus Eremiobacteraceae bacterium]|nr:L-histidine N(alpha)-methyltransferase [Candidatus Eremiobacteraceae bacterium]
MDFAADVRSGLSAPQKRLLPKYLYDDLGSALFDAITALPEYYLTNAEAEILRNHAGEIIDAVGYPVELIELGSGSAVKTRLLIDAAFVRQPTLRFCPIDISSAALDASAKALRREYPRIVVDGINAEYLSGIARLSRNGARCRLALFLGSNIGNFEPDEARATLSALRSVLDPGDGFLLGADLKKDARTLEAAYDDPTGVTAAFSRNLLGRINRELGGHFDLSTFQHTARYNPAASRIEIRLVSTVEQDVAIDRIGMVAHFEAGEPIYTESSYKFDDASISSLAVAAGFAVTGRWTDASERFADYLLTART